MENTTAGVLVMWISSNKDLLGKWDPFTKEAEGRVCGVSGHF